MAALGVVAVAATLALGSTLASQTDASLPWLDSATTVVSLVAQWMMTRKLLEHWLVWIGVDTVYVGMFLYKALYVTAGLYLVFLGLAVLGYRNWRRDVRGEVPTA
jgi:nicotinamide mononucleotide transporter